MNSIKQRIKHNTSPVNNIAAPFASTPRRTRSLDHSNHAHTTKWRNRALLLLGGVVIFFVGKNFSNGTTHYPASSPSSSRAQQLSRLRVQSSSTLRDDGANANVQRSNDGLSLLPYSKLQMIKTATNTPQQIPPNYGLSPLTGSFNLSPEYHLFQDNSSESTIGGIIYFPYADLSTLVPEDITASSFNFFPIKQNVDKVFKSVLVGNHINNDKQHLSKKQAILTRCGYKPSSPGGTSTAPNQDRSFIANFSLGSQSNTARDDNASAEDIQVPSALLMGIYDGHGGQGHVVSHFVALELPRIFTKLIQTKQAPSVGSSQYDDYIRQILKQTYLEVDSKEPVKGSAGCTASSIFYPGEGTKAYIANVGDSTTMIVKYSKSTKQSTIVHQNRKHKPHLPDEKLRINAAGGEVMIPPSLLVPKAGKSGDVIQESSRLMVPSPNGDPFGGMALAMSRAIGDSDAKVVGLISEPEVDVWDLNDYHTQHESTPEQINDTEWFAVAASDGMYDVISPVEVANKLGQSLYSDENVASPLEACEQLIRKATLLWMNMAGPYRDDISIGVSRLEFS